MSWKEEFEKSLKRSIKDVKKTSELLNQDITRNELPSSKGSCAVGSLDGGDQIRDFSGISVVFAQAAGTVFRQNHLPNWHEMKRIHLVTAPGNLTRYADLYRDILEMKIAQELLTDNPDIILLDGVHGSYIGRGFPKFIWKTLRDQKGDLHPSKTSFDFLEAYDQFCTEYDRLITSCLDRDILLIGVAKDSRYRRLAKSMNLPIKITDPMLVKWNFKGKTGYTDLVPTQPFTDEVSRTRWRSLGVLGTKTDCLTSYFVLEPNSIPFRVDILNQQRDRLEEIAGFFVTYHDGQGFLLPPRFAHQRAHAHRVEADRWADLLQNAILEEAPEIFDLFFAPKRRDSF